MALEVLELGLNLPTLDDFFDMEISVEWIVEKLIPKEAITVLHGKGGLGKSYLLLQLGSAIADGKPFCGFSTMKQNVFYIDYENPLPMLCDRAKVLGKSSLAVWHFTHDPPPPRLDGENWEQFKLLPPGLLIFDSMRSSHLLDEHDSKDMSLIMSRLKELCSLEHSIIGVLHSPKGDARTYRGSSVLIDQADHSLGLERVKGIGSDEAVDFEDERDLPLRLGHVHKTRFIPFKTYLKFDPFRGFNVAASPEDGTLEEMRHFLLQYFKNHEAPTQSQFAALIKESMDLGKSRILKLIAKGERGCWTTLIDRKKNNQRTYTPVFYEGE
jgi:hypothetical protein